MGVTGKSWTKAATLAAIPAVLALPLLRIAGLNLAGFVRIWPVLFFAPVAMWMEARSIKLVLATYQGRRDPFLLVAVPVGLTAFTAYILSAVLFAFAVPMFLHLLF